VDARSRSQTKRGGQCGWAESAALALTGVLSVGCARTAPAPPAVAPVDARPMWILHEACELVGPMVEAEDVNGDGRPELTTVRRGGRLHCSAADLDFDGGIEMYSYFDAQQKLRRRELDFDGDGRCDELELFRNGVLVQKLRAHSATGRVHTWESYEGGRLRRAERDADHNQRIDQWWDYPSPDCPVVRSDVDGDGKADPDSKLDLCALIAEEASSRGDGTAVSRFEREATPLPTEVTTSPGTSPKPEEP